MSDGILLTTTKKVCLIPSVKLLKGASKKTPFNNNPETEKKSSLKKVYVLVRNSNENMSSAEF